MRQLLVSLRKSSDDSYPIVIGSGASLLLGEDSVKRPLGSSYCVITDSNIRKLFCDKVAGILRGRGIKTEVISFPAGEQRKNFATVAAVCEEMARKKLGRDTVVVALGGGVVGDLAGFVAAIYCRGVPYVQVPTTLLAMVDSSIGGKTAVDLAGGKNMVGSFHQPKKVYIDTDFLKQLREKELRNGLAEAIKCGAIADAALFSFIEKNIDRILDRDNDAVGELIWRCCGIKKSVVELDETESGLRMILNFGHTVGHAIEMLSKYHTSHGEAIAAGMSVEAEISMMKGLLDSRDVERLKALITAAGLPVSLPSYSFEKLIDAMKSDKKARANQPRFVLLKSIGKVASSDGNYAFEVEENVVREAVEKCRERKG